MQQDEALSSIGLFLLSLLLFLVIKATVELPQNILNNLEIESTILSPEIKLFINTPCEIASKHDMNSAFRNRNSSYILLCASPRYSSTNKHENVPRCCFLLNPCNQQNSNMRSQSLQIISSFSHKHVILCLLKVFLHFVSSSPVVHVWITLISFQHSHSKCNVRSCVDLSIY